MPKDFKNIKRDPKEAGVFKDAVFTGGVFKAGVEIPIDKPKKTRTRKPGIIPSNTLKDRLRDGKITPKELFILRARDKVAKETTGKPLLGDKDRALLYNWTPGSQDEAIEYARYKDGWKTIGFTELDAKTSYLSAIIELLKIDKLELEICTNTDRIIFAPEIADLLREKGMISPIDKAKEVICNAEISKNKINLMFHYKRLLMFNRIFARLSPIYQVELGSKVKIWITELKAKGNAYDDRQRSLNEKKFSFLKRTNAPQPDDVICLNLESVKENKQKIELAYIREFRNLFADELGPGWYYGI